MFTWIWLRDGHNFLRNMEETFFKEETREERETIFHRLSLLMWKGIILLYNNNNIYYNNTI